MDNNYHTLIIAQLLYSIYTLSCGQKSCFKNSISIKIMKSCFPSHNFNWSYVLKTRSQRVCKKCAITRYNNKIFIMIILVNISRTRMLAYIMYVMQYVNLFFFFAFPNEAVDNSKMHQLANMALS